MRLHQAQDFGAEIVATVGPAQAATGDRAGAQMDALDARAVHPDFTPGQWRRQAGDERAVDLERQRLGRGRGIEVGAQRRGDDGTDQAQHAILVDRADLFQARVDLRLDGGRLVAAVLRGGIVQRFEQGDEVAGDALFTTQRVGKGRHAKGGAGLAQIAEQRAEEHHRARREAGGDDQFVEPVIFGDAFDHLGDCLGHHFGAVDHCLGIAAGRQFQHETLDMAERAAVDRRGHLVDHAEAEILEGGDDFGQGVLHRGFPQHRRLLLNHF